MSAARMVPHHIRHVQVQAADPDISAFVSANAGSGKTHVLTQRVINLLLRGCDPAKILCITFTKAAAANMATRVFNTLAEWTGLEDAALDEKIELSCGKKPNAIERARARRLFASALETPGGLKVQTIHAFCTRVLHQFPFEANVTTHFSVLDEASTAQMLDQITMEVLLAASATPENALGKALGTAIVETTDQSFKEVVNEAIKKRHELDIWLSRHKGDIEAAVAELSMALGIDPDVSEETICTECRNGAIPVDEWTKLAQLFSSGKKFDKFQALRWQRAAEAGWPGAIDHYLSLFLREDDGEQKDDPYVMGKELRDAHPMLWARLDAERARVAPFYSRLRAVRARERTRALITIAGEVIARYQRAKEQRALLDYDDLIDKTLELFARSSAAWVLYKLDLGIDHVLIDEAQDTSPKQWEIIRTICSEFIPGSRSETKRTLFAVGDEKQSIFSFQGAAPKAFDEMRRLFASQFNIPEQGWRYLRFHHSFRSGPNVLASVDRVFSAREVFASVTTDEAGIPPHQSLPDAAPGVVEIWPLVAPSDKREIEGWDAPFDTESEESPRVRLARKIATYVKRQIANGLNAGDVLILVRQRGPLFEAIIRALKNAKVPVAGADRLVLTEHIAVMDLMALADCLLLPNDDLALASVLKSPLFRLSEEQLFELAWERNGSLRSALRKRARDNPIFAEIEHKLTHLAQTAYNTDPFAFFAEVLGPLRGRQKFLARLGLEANDAIDEFLNLALAYETRQTPSLQGFLAWLRAAKSEVKRDMEMARDEVRVMTVHGAKGLEANTVILADTTTSPNGPRDPRLLNLFNSTLVWATARAEDVKPLTEARETARRDSRDEYRRLLYVAMTRAAERLIVCGAQGTKNIPDGCWYQLVTDALKLNCVSEPADDGEGEVFRYRKHAADVKILPRANQAITARVALPAWLSQNVVMDKSIISTITPSNAEEDTSIPAASTDNKNARIRGVLIHRLLQSLPELPVERRMQTMTDFLAHAGQMLGADECKKIVTQIMRLLNDERFQALYAADSRAEVDIVGTLSLGGRVVRVSGRIDRLTVTPNAVLIADFKTSQPPAPRIGRVPPAYARQLALYRGVLQKLYPSRPVRAILIWTQVPDFMELSSETLDAALAEIGSGAEVP